MLSTTDPMYESEAGRHRDALELGLARHNLILGLLDRPGAKKAADARFWSFGTSGSCALQMGARNIVLGELAPEDVAPLAAMLRSMPFAGIVGPEEGAKHLADAVAAHGIGFLPPVAQIIHQLDCAPRFPGADGEARELVEADRETFLRYTLAFYGEALPHDAVPPPERIGADVASGRHLFWVVDGEPVSLASEVRGTKTMSAIGGVYTPPPMRGRGYAGSVTAALSKRIFAAGKRLVCLYTDASNPYSNRCYAKIGFTPVCSAFHFVRKVS